MRFKTWINLAVASVLGATLLSGAFAAPRVFMGLDVVGGFTTAQTNQDPANPNNEVTVDVSSGPAFVRVTLGGQHDGSFPATILNWFVDLRDNFSGSNEGNLDVALNPSGGSTDMRKNATFHQSASDFGWITQTRAAVGTGSSGTGGFSGNGFIRANSVSPWDTNFPAVTHVGAAFKLLYTGGTYDTTPFWVGHFVVKIPQGSPVKDIVIGNTYVARDANGNIIGNFGATVRTTWGEDYYHRDNEAIGIIHVVPEPASLIALGTGLVGLVALRRRKR